MSEFTSKEQDALTRDLTPDEQRAVRRAMTLEVDDGAVELITLWQDLEDKKRLELLKFARLLAGRLAPARTR